MIQNFFTRCSLQDSALLQLKDRMIGKTSKLPERAGGEQIHSYRRAKPPLGANSRKEPKS